MLDKEFFYEIDRGGWGQLIRKARVLVDKETAYQKVLIFDNPSLGRVLALDGAVMLTERDEFTYHELLVHPALLAHPSPRRVLVIGGGDGGTLREIVKHPEVEVAILCEIDKEVIDLSREFLPFTASGLDHPKSKVHVGDGIAYIKNHKNSFDVILIDSTDPVGFAEGLFKSDFYEDVKQALRPEGIMVQQTESPFYIFDVWVDIFRNLKRVFPTVHCYAGSVPLYPSGAWTFGFASVESDPWTHFRAARIQRLRKLKYYTDKTQQSAFVLPAFAQQALEALDRE